jgi:hypothetical protein
MSGPKQTRPPPPTKVPNSKQSMFIQEEIEVAEVLFGLTRQFKQENQKQEQKESAESKSRASSPQQTSPLPPESNYNSSSMPFIGKFFIHLFLQFKQFIVSVLLGYLFFSYFDLSLAFDNSSKEEKTEKFEGR